MHRRPGKALPSVTHVPPHGVFLLVPVHVLTLLHVPHKLGRKSALPCGQ